MRSKIVHPVSAGADGKIFHLVHVERNPRNDTRMRQRRPLDSFKRYRQFMD